MNIRAESVLLEPSARVYLYTVDASPVEPAAGELNFHGYHQEESIFWRGVEYKAWPIQAEGFSKEGDRPVTPTLTVANLRGAITDLCSQFDDLVGALFIRHSTQVKYLDPVNFPGGVNPTADPQEAYPDEVWFLEQKDHEDFQTVRWKLSSALDFNGVQLPGRTIVANQCFFKYRSPECSYAGPPVAKYDDTPTTDPFLDNCSRKVSGCKLRFGADNPLPYGSFPSAGLVR